MSISGNPLFASSRTPGLVVQRVNWKTLLGLASLLGLLLLSGPGVRAAHAADDADSGQTCEAGGPDLDRSVAWMVEHLRRTQGERDVDDRAYALNNDGYHYDEKPAPPPRPGSR